MIGWLSAKTPMAGRVRALPMGLTPWVAGHGPHGWGLPFRVTRRWFA